MFVKIICSKCGKEVKDGNVCLSMIDKKDLCSDCATVEALKIHGDKNAYETLEKIKKQV